MYEQFLGDFTYRDSASRQVQLFISFVNFRATSLLSISYFFSTYSSIKNSLPCPKRILRTHYISMSLSTLFVRLFVNREPQQIFMGENTECWANLAKARVNFPVTLLHIYWVCQYKLFLISEGWERFTEPSKPSLEYHWSDSNLNVQQQYCI